MTLLDAWSLLGQLDLTAFVFLFWYVLVFDVSRYTVSLLSVIIDTWLPRRRSVEYRGPVSVLLVGFNEADGLEPSIRSLEEQTHSDLQIVVVDDGSTDDMAKRAQDLRRAGRIDVFIRAGIRGGKASALNLGFGRCRHPVVVTADIDTSFDRDAIERLVAPFGEPLVGATAGNLGVRNESACTLATLQSMQYLVSISLGRRFTSMMGWLLIVSGAFGAYRRAAVEAVGGWDVGPGDDSNLTTKVRRSGWDVRFAHDAWALTDVPERVGALVRQQLRWNRSIVRNRLRKFRGVFNPRHANFLLQDALAFANILFFQVALSCSFIAYLLWLLLFHSDIAALIIFTVSLLYVFEDLVVLSIAGLMYPRRVSPRLLLFTPLATFFKSYFLRVVRCIACIDELVFRRSYEDPFYPTKVRNAVEQF